MSKVILLTGATDGIGLSTARNLVEQGHGVLIHGRSSAKLHKVAHELGLPESATYCYDLSKLASVAEMTKDIQETQSKLDVIINNAGVFKAPNTRTEDGLDLRFAVNTIAPYMLTQGLNTLLCKTSGSRVVNVSSASQGAVNLDALRGNAPLSDYDAYAQSKLAIIQWSNALVAKQQKPSHLPTPMIVSVNPASLLGSKMVKSAFGIDGKDLSIGANILVKAALSEDFQNASGKYFDNDNQMFTPPHPDASDPKNNQRVVEAMEEILERLNL
jgi:NAD(P)-dependent dehydrogenase (short-subunit alcohol dehydrogenase family)